MVVKTIVHDTGTSFKKKYKFINNYNNNKRYLLEKFVYFLIFITLVVWSGKSINFNFLKLRKGFYGILDILSRMFPPAFYLLPNLIRPTIETVQMSICGTILAVIISIPLGLLAARNISPNMAIYQASRLLLNTIRAIPEMIFALIFVAAVGLGPFPGTLAIGFSSSGMLGKFIADSIEGVDQGPLDALRATGAEPAQVFIYSVIPQIMPEFISVALFRWEMNFRASTILGIVGAGGIGFELTASMRLFKYKETTMVLAVILVVVSIVDFISNTIRKKIIWE